MFGNFIDNHKKIAIVILIVLGIGLITTTIIYTVSNITNKSSSSNTVNESDGVGEATSTLPYSNLLYTISIPVDNTITITAFPGYRNAAVNQLMTFGLDPTNYKIVFNYESPFKRYE